MQPLVLLILDGWGWSPEVMGNPILNVPTPNFDFLLSNYPFASLHASGEEVGLSWGEMGNSEVGHLNLGLGRIVMQDLPRIDKSIEDETFYLNKELNNIINYTLKNNTNLHLIGLVSAGGVHSHINHLYALLKLAKLKKCSKVYIHMITDGRDTPPKTAFKDTQDLLTTINKIGVGKIATVVGRYYAMDRDKHWDRIQKAYEALINDINIQPDALTAINYAYSKNQTDEFIEPMTIQQSARIQDNDGIIFFNYRSDRAKQLTDSIINRNFNGFSRSKIINNCFFVSFTNYGYEPSPNVKVAFFAEKSINQLAKLLSDNHYYQLHAAETEKYAHVTYFFNGGIENPFTFEERILVQSPKVATYDLKPEMSAYELADKFICAFETKKYHFSVINFANLDMVGHTGDINATNKAITVVDEILGKLIKKIIPNQWNLIVTADHGNAEQMINPVTQEPDKEHTTNPVPIIFVMKEKRYKNPIPIDLDTKVTSASKPPIGVLADVTVTCLDFLNLPKPQGMSGISLRKVI